MTTLQIASAIIFALALLHSLSAAWIDRLARYMHPRYSNLLHLLGEVELVFGFWAFVLLAVMALLESPTAAMAYAQSRNYTESLFVFVIMVVAASRPVLFLAQAIIGRIAHLVPINTAVTQTWLAIVAVPLLGSLITEPAAMTLAALILFPLLFSQGHVAEWKKYAALGVLFVNISIGGTLTNFAAPPILMVASTWGWSSAFVLRYFGTSAMVAIVINASLLVVFLYRDLTLVKPVSNSNTWVANQAVPLLISLVHLMFLFLVIVFAHYPVLFIGVFVIFVGFTQAFQKHQSPPIYKEAFLVAFFLMGLVLVGGLQDWWIQPMISRLEPMTLFVSTIGLTAITDNAAVTYLASLVPSLTLVAKYMLVSGAVVGGGLTLIANAPNPAGASLLKEGFKERSIGFVGLFLGAVFPTIVAAFCFIWIGFPPLMVR